MNIRRVYWGIVLILLGVLGLGVTMGWFTNVNIWALIGPFFLIALGIWFLIRPRGSNYHEYHGRHQQSVQTDSIPLDGAQEAEIIFEHGAGKLNITGAAKEGGLVEGEFYGGFRKKTSKSGTSLKVNLEGEYGFPDEGPDWIVRLTDSIPLKLSLQTGASEVTCDLTDLKVKEVDLDTGASSSRIKLPARAGYTLVDIDAGAASVEMTVPAGVAASIKVDAALMKKTIDEKRFPYNGERYLSPDYETAENKVEIKIDSAVGSVSIQ
jgi:hypothetical protein